MAENSKIEWTHHTFNPWIGCTKVSDGCKHCYAETLMDTRYKKTKWGPRGLRVIKAESGWKEPLKWNRAAEAAGERHRVFCASLSDVFEGPETMPAESREHVESARHRLFDLIYQTPHLDWLLLTKRPENACQWIGGESGAGLETFVENFPNVWLGTSVENQATADERIPHLLKCPAAVRFLSCEPLLGPVDLTSLSVGTVDYADTGESSPVVANALNPHPWGGNRIDWVIVGGESGPGARPMHPHWAGSIRDQCTVARVPFLFKQNGEWKPIASWRDEPNYDRLAATDRAFNVSPDRHDMGDRTQLMVAVGKHAAGRLLDGVEHNGFPEPITATK